MSDRMDNLYHFRATRKGIDKYNPQDLCAMNRKQFQDAVNREFGFYNRFNILLPSKTDSIEFVVNKDNEIEKPMCPRCATRYMILTNISTGKCCEYIRPEDSTNFWKA